MIKQRDGDYDKVKCNQKERKDQSRKRKREENPQKELENNRRLLQKHRNADTPEARLKRCIRNCIFNSLQVIFRGNFLCDPYKQVGMIEVLPM